jgi:hypothetical protein
MDVAVTQEYAKPQTSHIEAQEFWKWAFSDFLSNALRGVLA